MAQTNSSDWIDVSVPLHPGMVHWPGDPEFESKLEHSLDRGDVCNLAHISTSVHIGTHMDAPRHFVRGGAGMDQLPLAAVIGPCRIIQIDDPEAIRPAELVPHGLRRNERVLFRTRNSEGAWSSPEFVKEFVYISQEAARHIVEAGVQTVGVDYLSIGGFFKDGVETHNALLGAGVWVIEGLNLKNVTPGAYELVCLPIHLLGSDGAPARAVLRRVFPP